MKRLLPLCRVLVSFMALASVASAATPILRAELDTSVAVPGQVIVLEVTILVPTWMPRPPVFPTFELTDVRVRLPEGASGPTMERVDGENWPGVTRSYQISPIVPGHFRIAPQIVTVTYADPETLRPTVVELRTKEIVFEGRVPPGAENLDPFIAAEALTLEQIIEGEPDHLEPGAAFTRIVTARVTGASSIFLPPLIPPFEADGLVAYPREPDFREKAERGVIVGERVERVTYVAEAGGRFRTDPVRLRWWNLRTKRIELAEIGALEITSRGPPAMSAPKAEAQSAYTLGALGGLALILIAVLFAGRWVRPRWANSRRKRRDARLASERHAFEQVADALRSRNFGDAVCCVQVWSSRLPELSEADRHRLFEALQPLGAALYGADAKAPSKKLWSQAANDLRETRRRCLEFARRRRVHRILPSLNPNRVG